MKHAFDNEEKHILARLGINVGPVLLDAAQDHLNICGKPIAYFILPGWMYKKLSREPGFEQSECVSMAHWQGFIVFKHEQTPYPAMREKGDRAYYKVFYERKERTAP